MSEENVNDAETDVDNDGTLVTDGGEKDVNDNEKVVEGEEGDKSESTDSDADKDEKVAPENYEEFKVPEGMEIDQTLLEEALPVFKELGLTQDGAQKLVDIQSKFAQQQAEQQQEAWAKTMADWQKSVKDDKEIGGQHFEENIGVAKEAIKSFGNDAFVEMLEVTGVGNHPEMVRFLLQVGKAVKDDTVGQGTGSESAQDAASLIYTSMAGKN